jgi:hypothetical protein
VSFGTPPAGLEPSFLKNHRSWLEGAEFLRLSRSVTLGRALDPPSGAPPPYRALRTDSAELTDKPLSGSTKRALITPLSMMAA